MRTNYFKSVCTLTNALALLTIIGSSAVLLAPATAWAGKNTGGSGPTEIGTTKQPVCGTPEAKNAKGPCEIDGSVQQPACGSAEAKNSKGPCERVGARIQRPMSTTPGKIGYTQPKRTILPDISTKLTGSFGKKTFRHGQTLVVTKRDATSLSNNVCKFRLGYGVRTSSNTGRSFLNKVKRYSNTFPGNHSYMHDRIPQMMAVANFYNMELKPARQVPGEPALPIKYGISIGSNLAVKGRRYVKESNYNNNVVKFQVVLNGDCKSGGNSVKPDPIRRQLK